METNSSTQMISAMPPELAGQLPRRIRPSASSRYMEIADALVLAFTLILTLWAGKAAVQHMQRRSTLRQAGTDAPGEITRIESVPRSMDIVSYTFTVNGRTFSGEAGVPARLERNLHESDALMVRYVPSNPTINHPSAWEYSLWSNFVGIVFLVFLSSMFSLFLVSGYRWRQLLARGKPAVAIVIECAPAKASFSLKYEFRTETGIVIRGRGWSGICRKIGASIWILYMPKNPRRNHPYPFPDFRVCPTSAEMGRLIESF